MPRFNPMFVKGAPGATELIPYTHRHTFILKDRWKLRTFGHIWSGIPAYLSGIYGFQCIINFTFVRWWWPGVLNSVIFPIPQHCVSNNLLWNYMFRFDRHRRSWAVLTPVKYESDSKNLTVRIENLLIKKLMNRAFVTPTPGPFVSAVWTSNFDIWFLPLLS